MNIEETMDPELLAVLKAMPSLGDGLTLDPAASRKAMMEMLAAFKLPASDKVNIESRHIPGPAGAPEVYVKIYTPTTRTAAAIPGLLWIHGGGFIVGHPDMDDSNCSRYVETANCVVVSVDWRLAPEDPFPAGPEDCYAALKWMVDHASDLGIDTERVAVAGASAGGGVCAAVALMARDRGGPKLCFQMPLYGCFDDRHSTQSSYDVTDPRVWSRDISLKAWKMYLAGNDMENLSSYAAPSRAKDLSGLPPAYLMIGELDLMRDENIEYATRLMQAGVPTELHIYPGAFHGFDLMGQSAAISQRAVAEYTDALRRALNP